MASPSLLTDNLLSFEDTDIQKPCRLNRADTQNAAYTRQKKKRKKKEESTDYHHLHPLEKSTARPCTKISLSELDCLGKEYLDKRRSEKGSTSTPRSVSDERQIRGLQPLEGGDWNGQFCVEKNKRNKREKGIYKYKVQKKDTEEEVVINNRSKVHNLVALVTACARQKDLGKGSRLHADIARLGLLEKDLFVGSSLVSMYAKCGSLVKAQELCNKIPVRNVVSWNALIAGYTQHGYGLQALKCFEQMQLEGVSPDAVTYICTLKACSIIGAICKGQEIHAEIAISDILNKSIAVGNVLVDMYAKFGLLAKARDVFDKFPVRDVVTCSALIAGYAQHGHGKEALNCYEQMQLEGILPNAITFVCILKACGSLQAIIQGQEIHAEIVSAGLLEKDLGVGNAVVDMYAKCCLLVKAHEVFAKLPFRDIVSWSALIAGYAQHGQGQAALNCFDRMQFEGLSPNVVTFACVLKACGGLRAADKGQEIHGKIEREGWVEKDIFIGNALVDMYAKCGLLGKAHDVFEKLPFRDVVSWSALISGYTEHGHGEEAVNCFERMQLEGPSPTAVTLVCILKACGSIGAGNKGQAIHAEIAREGLLEKDIVVGNAVVDMYGKCGLLAKAQEVFDKLPSRDVVTWNALLAGYAQHGHDEQALNCFLWMQLEGISPDAITYVCILKACASIGAAHKGQELYHEIVREGLLEKDVIVGNALIDMYAKCCLLEKAEEVFDKLLLRDEVSWSVLIAGYVLHGHNEEALNYFTQMHLKGVSPSTATFVCILNACGSLEATGKGREIHAIIVREGLLELECAVGNALVDMYIKCGLLAKAKELFDKLPFHDTVLWSTLIAGHAGCGLGEEALNYFEQMQLEGISANTVTFICLLKACGSVGSPKKGQELHAEIDREGLLEKDIIVGTALIDMYAKCGQVAKAQEVFDKLLVRDVVSWNVLITGYSLLGKIQNVFYSFDKMRREGIQPDTVTFTIVLNACSHTGLVDNGKAHFERMNTVYGIIPTLEHYTCMVDLFGRAGHLAKVVAMINDMPLSANLSMWHSVLAACQRWGDIKLGRLAFEHAVQLNEKDAAVYVSMSNINTVQTQ